MKKKYHSWVLSHTVGKANRITLQTDEQQAELIAQRLTAGIAFDHEREIDAIFGTSSGKSTDPEDTDDGESEKDNKHCTNEKQSSAHKNHISDDKEKNQTPGLDLPMRKNEAMRGDINLERITRNVSETPSDDMITELTNPGNRNQEKDKRAMSSSNDNIGSKNSFKFQAMPIRIQIRACLGLEPSSTIGWDSFAGITVSDQKNNFLYLINDGPLMQSDIVLEGLAGTAMRPTAEGPLLVKCIDPKTQAVVFKVDPHALYVPDCKVQVFSSCKMAEYGHGIVQNYQRVIGNHVILDCNTQEILNLRVNGAVLSNKTMNYDRSTVKLPQHILHCLHVTLPLCKMIGIPKRGSEQAE